MKCTKFYITAMAATGKSTFANQHPTYRDYHIVDYAERLPKFTLWTRFILYVSRLIKPLRKLVRKRPDIVARRQKNYFEKAFDFMVEHEEPVVVFGRLPPDEFEELPVHDKIRFGMIIIPEDDHRRNCASRKKQLRNPFPFLHHWTTDFEKIQALRLQLQEYAEKHNIPVYESFADAIDNMHQSFNSSSV